MRAIKICFTLVNLQETRLRWASRPWASCQEAHGPRCSPDIIMKHAIWQHWFLQLTEVAGLAQQLTQFLAIG